MIVLRSFSIRQVVIGMMATFTVIAVGCILALLVISGRLRDSTAQESQRLLADEAVADRIVFQVQHQLAAAQRYIDSGEPLHLRTFRAEGLAVYDQLRLYLFRPLGAQERLLVERIRESHQAIEVGAQRAFEARQGIGVSTDLPGVRELQEELAEFLDLRRQQTQEVLDRQHRVWAWMYIVCAILAALFVSVMFVVALFLRRRLLEPLRALSRAARRVGAGDFDTRVVVTGETELAAVAHSFNRMAERLDQARRDAQDAEHRYRDLIEGVSTVVWEADAETFRCSYVSPQAEAMLGHPFSEWESGTIWQTLIHPDDYDLAVRMCVASVQSGDDHVMEYRAVRADGSVLWLSDSVRVLLDEHGRPMRLRGVLTDVTAARAAGDALRDSEQRYRSLFESVPVGLYRSTPDGRMIDANPVLVELLGYPSRDALLESNAADVYLDADARRQWQQMLDAAADVVEIDRQHRRLDGTIVWLRDTARAVRRANGSVMYYEGALQDVTAHMDAQEVVRRSEARFRSLIENATDGVVILSADGLMTYQSPAVERMLGYRPEDRIGTSPFELVHPDDHAEVVQSFIEVMEPGGHGKSVEFRCRHADGSYRTLHALGTNLLDDPAVGGVVVNMIDATVHRSLEEQLQHSQRLEAIGRLAGGIAHDFNNLLTAIRGYTDLLGDKVDGDARARADVLEIRRAVERAARLTRQLLAFSRRQVVRPQPTEVGSVIIELEKMLRRLIMEEVPLVTAVVKDAWVFVDPGQLEQVVVNLVVNARDAQPRTGIRATVDLATLPADDRSARGVPAGDYVRLTVADDGAGIDRDTLPHIFEPFFTTKDVGQGTGLGLATVYGIVRDAGGHIRVDSDVNVGTTVRVYLPRIARPADDSTVPRMRVVEPGQGTEQVLLVEDEPAVRSLAERVLTRQGYRVISAGSGVEALRLVAETHGQIDLLISDVVMPEMGGVQLAEHLLALRPDLRVLFISGYAADAVPTTDVHGRQLHFLEKPFSPSRFAEYVRAILDGPVTARNGAGYTDTDGAADTVDVAGSVRSGADR